MSELEIVTRLEAPKRYMERSTEESELEFAKHCVQEINNDLNDIKHSFFRIGFRLHLVAQMGYYSKLGYKNITDFALDKFGFSQSTTYELIGIYELAHKEDAPLQIAEKYDEFSQSQLRELCRLKIDPNGFMRIVKPSDTVEKVGKAVTFWNKYVARHSGTPDVNNITELLQLDIDTPMRDAQAYLKRKAEREKTENSAYAENQSKEPSYTGQLKGQTAMQLPELSEPKNDNFSAYAEKSEPLEELANALMTDDELIKQSIKRGSGVHNGKFEIVEYYSQSPLQNEFMKFVQNQYELTNRYNAAWFKNIKVNCKTFTIHRERGGKIVLPWSVVAGHVSRFITAGEYLTEDEKARYLQWKAEKDSAVTIASEPSEEREEPEAPDEEYSQYNEEYRGAIELTPRRQLTNREFLATLPDEEFIGRLLVKILKLYHFNGKSALFTSTVRTPLKEWLSEPHEVTE